MTHAKSTFGPANRDEELIFAVEGLLADVQLSIEEAMLNLGVSRSELARRLGCSAANVTQLLSEDANLTVQTVAKILHCLGMKAQLRLRFTTPEALTRSEDDSGRAGVARWEIAPVEDPVSRSRSQMGRQAPAERPDTAPLFMEVARRAANSNADQLENSGVIRHDSARANAA